jgi:hypothetical protein
MVQPESLDVSDESKPALPAIGDPEDPLLDLFLRKSSLSPQQFHVELGKQRGSHAPEEAAAATV